MAEQKKEDTKNALVGCGVLALGGVFLLGFCAPDESDEPTPPAEAGSASEDVQAAIDQFSESVTLHTSKCELVTQHLSDGLLNQEGSNTNVYELYNRSTLASDVCRQYYFELNEIAIPAAFDSGTEEKAEEAIDSCRDSMLARQMAADNVAAFLDGDSSPSKMQEISGDADHVQRTTLECATALMDTAKHAGGELNLDE